MSILPLWLIATANPCGRMHIIRVFNILSMSLCKEQLR